MAAAKRNNYDRDEFLIECVRQYKPLYDMQKKNYRESKNVKENCWKVVETMRNAGYDTDSE